MHYPIHAQADISQAISQEHYFHIKKAFKSLLTVQAFFLREPSWTGSVEMIANDGKGPKCCFSITSIVFGYALLIFIFWRCKPDFALLI